MPNNHPEQGSIFQAVQSFGLKSPDGGRIMQVKPGERFCVVSTSSGPLGRAGLVQFDREGRAKIGAGKTLTLVEFFKLFEVVSR